MIIWINGAFGAGKTTVAYDLNRRLSHSFVYDPENAGYFLRKNMPKKILKSDFQDHFAWRDINYAVLLTIAQEYNGPIIVPMTLVNLQYLNELVGKLRASNIEIKHFTLNASRETLIKRLKRRGEGKDSWPVQQIDRCIASLKNEQFETHIQTDNLTTEEITRFIAHECQLELKQDNRSVLKKKWDSLMFRFKH